MWLPGRGRRLTICSAVWIQYTNVTDGRTDRRTDIGSQQRPRFRIASRGKKYLSQIIAEYRRCRIILHCHWNGIRKKLLMEFFATGLASVAALQRNVFVLIVSTFLLHLHASRATSVSIPAGFPLYPPGLVIPISEQSV